MKKGADRKAHKVSRRDFIKRSAAVSLAALTSAGASRLFAAGSDKLRVGLIGCGARGTGAAMDCVRSSRGVEIVAMADVFKDKLDKSLAKLRSKVSDKVSVTVQSCYLGFGAYKKVLARDDVDLVLLTTPPGFRPEVGSQRRHEARYLEIIRRIHNGAIGKIVSGQCYWNWGEQNWHFAKRRPEWSDMEWQIRCWPYFTWLSGDHIVEQHVHNLDVINWAIGSHPVKCLGMGGRQTRVGPEYGNIYDHFAVEYEYPGGVRIMSMCRQIRGTSQRISERVVGTKGVADGNGKIEGQNAYKYDGPNPNPYMKEHADLIASIRNGKPLNEGRRIAESTLTAIMGRISAYTGRELKWDWVMNASKLDLRPPKYELGDLPVRPVAIPGKTKLI